MPRTVLLEHRTPDGGSHYDWLFALDDLPHDPDERVLIAFRVSERIDLERTDAIFEGERIEDHRWVYLEYEGRISGDRGEVERVAEGVWTLEEIAPGSIKGEMEWAGASRWRIEGRPIDSATWVFQISPSHRR